MRSPRRFIAALFRPNLLLCSFAAGLSPARHPRLLCQLLALHLRQPGGAAAQPAQGAGAAGWHRYGGRWVRWQGARMARWGGRVGGQTALACCSLLAMSRLAVGALHKCCLLLALPACFPALCFAAVDLKDGKWFEFRSYTNGPMEADLANMVRRAVLWYVVLCCAALCGAATCHAVPTRSIRQMSQVEHCWIGGPAALQLHQALHAILYPCCSQTRASSLHPCCPCTSSTASG